MLLRPEWRPLLEVRWRQRFSRRSSLTEGNPRARRSASTASNSEENMTVSSKVRCVDCDTGDTAPVLLLSLCFIQMNLVESLLLMSTSSSRSLALTCLYSLYSTASGERSSFCTFLQEQGGKRYVAARKKTLRVEVSYYAVPNIWHWQTLFFLPSVLSKKLVLKLFQVLANPLLLLSRLLELLYKFLPVGWGEMFFKCLTLKYTQTSSIYKKSPKNQQLWHGFCFFVLHRSHRWEATCLQTN